MAKPKVSRAERRQERKAAKEAKRKQPATTVKPSGEKRPVPGPPVPEVENATIVFRLSLMDHGGRWSFSNLPEAEIRQIAAFAKNIESLKPGELLNVAGTKPIPWDSMIPDAQKRAQEIELDQFDGLFELRLGNRPRLFGLLDQHCFYPVWWDPDHEICSSQKRNT